MLNKGDSIGVFSSSYPLTAIGIKASERACAFLQDKGYKIIKGNLYGKRDYYRSGNISERAAEFNDLLHNPNVKCLMASVGGMVSNAILPYIDFDYLKQNPKAIIGHSDITAILLAVYKKTRLVSYYGPNLVTTFGQRDPFLEYSFNSFESILNNPVFPVTYEKAPVFSDELSDWEKDITPIQSLENNWITVIPGVAEGRLMGGNLNTINGIMASPYMPDFQKGDILFLEDTEKFAAYSERYYSTLKICGVFDKVSGIILGKHRRFDDQETGKTHIDILLEILNGQQIPILADIDCCHTVPMLTLPIGSIVKIDATRKLIKIIKI